jgi:hypothetical protein
MYNRDKSNDNNTVSTLIRYARAFLEYIRMPFFMFFYFSSSSVIKMAFCLTANKSLFFWVKSQIVIFINLLKNNDFFTIKRAQLIS